MTVKNRRPKSEWTWVEYGGVNPPSTYMVFEEPESKPLLYKADGTPLTRKRPAGFDTAGRNRGDR